MTWQATSIRPYHSEAPGGEGEGEEERVRYSGRAVQVDPGCVRDRCQRLTHNDATELLSYSTLRGAGRPHG